MQHRFSTAERTLLDSANARVFFDGVFTRPKLNHPEGVAIGPDGWIWAGTDAGDIFRISPDGQNHKVTYQLGGFALGLAFDGSRALFVCDLERACVLRVDLATGTVAQWSHPALRIPNFPVVDRASGQLFVSDSHDPGRAGPGIFAFDLETGDSTLWLDAPLQFANGLAMREDERAVYVAETFARRVSRVAINDDGTAGPPEPFATDLDGLPDGLAFDAVGNLVVGCYEPSRLLRIPAKGGTGEVLIEDATAHVLCHPTNIAFAGDRLFAANLGRWHITAIDMDIGAPALWEFNQ